MPAILWAHLCENAFLEEDGRPSIIGVIDGISSSVFPVRYTPLCVGMRITAAEGDRFSTRSAIADDQGVRIIETDVINVDASNPENVPGVDSGIVNQFQRFVFINTVFPRPGLYSVEIIFDNILVHTIPLILAKVN